VIDPETGEPVEDFAARGRRKRRRRRELLDPAARAKLRRRKLKKRREAAIRPSPPLEATDPLGAYLAGEMVPCPVGCGGFSEVVRVGTLESGAGEVWFECLSCAQRRMFEVPRATPAETASIAAAAEVEGHDMQCPRHGRPVTVRRRGRDFVCPECGVIFPLDG
jgi:hypothetical protein